MKDFNKILYIIILCGILINCASNYAPVIEELNATPPILFPLGSTTLYVSATDEDGDNITYSWQCLNGRLSSTSGQSVDWTAPIHEGIYQISVVVKDEYGAMSSDYIEVLVTSTIPAKPEVNYLACNTGGSLQLFWPYGPNIESYNIYADGELLCVTTDSAYKATIPAKVYEISACFGNYESEKAKIDCTPVITSNITVYGHLSGSHFPSAIGFTEDGVATTWILEDTTYWPFLDYYLYDSYILQLKSPDIAYYVDTVFNDKHHTAKNSGQIDFNTLDSADIIASYTAVTGLLENMVYSMWLDSDADGWDNSSDHFAKMKVENIVGGPRTFTATLTIAYQKIPGLRWLVTE